MQKVIDDLKEDIAETDQDYNELLEENRRLKQLMADAEEAAKSGKGNRKFADLKGLKSSEDAPPGGGGNLFTNSMQRPKTETDSERKARE